MGCLELEAGSIDLTYKFQETNGLKGQLNSAQAFKPGVNNIISHTAGYELLRMKNPLPAEMNEELWSWEFW